MSITWANLRSAIQRRIEDEGGSQYSTDAIRDEVVWALRNFAATHTAVASVSTLEGNGTTTQFDLPENCLAVPGKQVYFVRDDSDNAYLARTNYVPYLNSSSDDPRYVLWPRGKITFTIAPDSTVTIGYVAHYNAPINDTDVVDVPEWAVEAITLYVVSRLWAVSSGSTSRIRQFNVSSDSGTPVHNPLLDQARYLMSEYHKLLSLVPAPQYELLNPVADVESGRSWE